MLWVVIQAVRAGVVGNVGLLRSRSLSVLIKRGRIYTSMGPPLGRYHVLFTRQDEISFDRLIFWPWDARDPRPITIFGYLALAARNLITLPI